MYICIIGDRDTSIYTYPSHIPSTIEKYDYTITIPHITYKTTKSRFYNSTSTHSNDVDFKNNIVNNKTNGR